MYPLDHLERSGLARAVWSEESEDPTPLDLEGYVVYRPEITALRMAKDLDEVFDPKRGCVGRLVGSH